MSLWAEERARKSKNLRIPEVIGIDGKQVPVKNALEVLRRASVVRVTINEQIWSLVINYHLSDGFSAYMWGNSGAHLTCDYGDFSKVIIFAETDTPSSSLLIELINIQAFQSARIKRIEGNIAKLLE